MKKGHCKHYNGNVWKQGECDAGINVRELVGGGLKGWMARKPCFKEQNSCITCDNFCEPTDQEIAEEEAWIDKKIEEMRLVSPFIKSLKDKHRQQGGFGTDKCPICGNKLHWKISSYNAHMHGTCETDGCLNWME